MESIIRGLLNGKIIPWERQGPQNAECLEAIRKIDTEERYFTQKMSPDDGGRFRALTELYADFGAMEEEKSLSCGFALGLLLALDAVREVETFFCK